MVTKRKKALKKKFSEIPTDDIHNGWMRVRDFAKKEKKTDQTIFNWANGGSINAGLFQGIIFVREKVSTMSNLQRNGVKKLHNL